MVVNDILNEDILPLQPSDTGNVALNWMEELRLSHLPVVADDSYLGLISDKEIYLMDNADQPLSSSHHAFARPYIFSSQHVYDLFRILSSLNISLVPVLDDKEIYKGSVIVSELPGKLSQLCSLSQPGSIIVLEMNLVDYSLHEIARIVESNDAKILHSGIRTLNEGNNLIEVTLKINKIDVSSVIQTFQRYEYDVVASFSEENDYEDLLKERFDSLMSYLKV